LHEQGQAEEAWNIREEMLRSLEERLGVAPEYWTVALQRKYSVCDREDVLNKLLLDTGMQPSAGDHLALREVWELFPRVLARLCDTAARSQAQSANLHFLRMSSSSYSFILRWAPWE
jgi:hypothetical protein